LRGKQVGNDDAIAAVKANADQRAGDVMRRIEAICEETGASSYGQLANALNERGVRTARGGRWHPATVKRVLARGTGG
jgi:hypothetical protein